MDPSEVHETPDMTYGLTGTLLTPRYSVDLWDESLSRTIDSICPGEILLVVSCKFPKTPQSKLNIDLWRKVVASPRGSIGWIHLDCLKILK